ncbi:universal stress protein, partial [Salmonella enterica]|uniref:universal stress protein n=2 Tax=Salmonella enterica TaxID=28901 RepID=UPI000A8F317B
MAMYQNMLVVIDPNQDDQPALRRAVYLHQRIGGKIKAFLPIYDFSYEMTTLLSPDERTAMRQGVISQRTAWIREQAKYGTVAKLAMRQPFVLFKGLTFQKLCLPGAF